MFIFYFLIFFFLVEFIIYVLFRWLKSDFKWLIHINDSFPSFNKNLIKKYNKYIFDKDLGWDNSKLKKIENLNSKKVVEYNFDSYGSRVTNNKYKYSKKFIFGDSYSMSRYSNDNETIQFFIENRLKQKVFNYGVGNYGLDQVFLKIKKKSLNKCKEVIIIFVPETIMRVQSYWKHFLEFGNILGFKPKFDYENKKLILKKDHLKKLNFDRTNKIINNLKIRDYFYENKFKKYSFSFPFSISFIQNFYENSKIFLNLLLYKFSDNKKFYNKAFNVIISRNIIETQKNYKNILFSELLKKIIIEINDYLKRRKIKTFFFVVPQYLDLKLFGKKSNSSFYFKKFLKSEKINLFDLTEDLMKYKKIEELYINDNYGGHLNEIGNKFVAEKIVKKIKKRL